MFCKRCEYNLKHLESRTCPECGCAFDPANRKTYRKRVGLPKFIRRFLQGLLVLCVVVSIALGVIEVRYQRAMTSVETLKQIGAYLEWSDDAHEWAEDIPFLHKRLQHIHFINLTNTGLVTIPAELWMHTSLAWLDLNRNQLAVLPPEIGKFINLTYLDLSDNQLTTLPAEIGKYSKLEVLELHENQITTLPPEISKLRNLTDLSLNYNRIATIPPAISELTQLKLLDLNHNQITRLPKELGNLMNLEVLILHNNQLVKIPPEIDRLINLKELDLRINPLSDMELEPLKSLANLQLLNLFGTKVTRQGVAALRLALPKCEIQSEFD